MFNYNKIGSITQRRKWNKWIRTRSQAVASIADRTALQHLSGSRDVIGHVTI